MWYWYISGAVTVLFLESIILNVGLMTGFIQWRHGKKNSVVRLYDQDNSGSIRRSA